MSEREHIPLDQIQPDPIRLERVLRRARLTHAPSSECANSQQWYDAYERPERFRIESQIDTQQLRAEEIFATSEQAPLIKTVRGSVYSYVASVLSRTEADWRAYYPAITRSEIAELSRSIGLLDLDVFEDIARRYGMTGDDHRMLRPRLQRHIEGLSPAYADAFEAGIPAGLLSEPPYFTQTGALSCATACFRMIFAGIAGDTLPPPAEYAVQQYEDEHPAFNESTMFRSLASPYFKQKTGRTVLNRVLVGATFEDITTRARKISQSYPGADTYAMLGVKNFDDKSAANLHAVVLLDADDEKVTFHNPIKRSVCGVESGGPWRVGGERETIDRQEFVGRWAWSLYTAQMVFALPPEPKPEQ